MSGHGSLKIVDDNNCVYRLDRTYCYHSDKTYWARLYTIL